MQDNYKQLLIKYDLCFFILKQIFFKLILSNMHGFQNYKEQKLNYKNGDEKENVFFIQ